jgi:hypothetical protein
MDMFKEGQAAVTHLQKAGKAQLIVELVAAPDDPTFIADPPSCSVTINAADPTDPDKVLLGMTKEISRQTDRMDRTFQLSAETSVGVLRRSFLREKPKSLELKITVTPINGWEEYYEPTEKIITVTAGEMRPLSVSLNPKATRTSRPVRLDKGRK